jgi:hypothetical protein
VVSLLRDVLHGDLAWVGASIDGKSCRSGTVAQVSGDW